MDLSVFDDDSSEELTNNFNNLITGILGNVGLLLMEEGLSEQMGIRLRHLSLLSKRLAKFGNKHFEDKIPVEKHSQVCLACPSVEYDEH